MDLEKKVEDYIKEKGLKGETAEQFRAKIHKYEYFRPDF